MSEALEGQGKGYPETHCKIPPEKAYLGRSVNTFKHFIVSCQAGRISVYALPAHRSGEALKTPQMGDQKNAHRKEYTES